jgi:hypothetical protein
MQLSHNFSAMSVAFTEENLIGSAGLVPAVGLATQIGLVGLGQEHVKLSGPGRANAGVKLMSIVAGMLAGADSITDMGQLRHGGMERVFTQMRAPSTLGTFLRCFTFGWGSPRLRGSPPGRRGGLAGTGAAHRVHPGTG